MAVKLERKKNGVVAVTAKVASRKPVELDYETLLAKIENDPDAPPIAKAAAAYRRLRDSSGKPYLTIEEIQTELGRE